MCTLPTYNEAQNILPLCRELLALGSSFEVLVIDDDSPDGTWKLVEAERAREPRLHLLHRRTDRGRGSAGREGFLAALRMGADVVIEMDADGSHQPRFVPELVARLDGPSPRPGLVLGSRGVAGGRDADRGVARRALTKGSNWYVRTVLGLSVRDCNSGFRCWRRETLESIRVERTFSTGPAIVQELLFKTFRAGIPVAEIPIEFVDRERGESTLTWRALVRASTTVWKLRWLAASGKL